MKYRDKLREYLGKEGYYSGIDYFSLSFNYAYPYTSKGIIKEIGDDFIVISVKNKGKNYEQIVPLSSFSITINEKV